MKSAKRSPGRNNRGGSRWRMVIIRDVVREYGYA